MKKYLSVSFDAVIVVQCKLSQIHNHGEKRRKMADYTQYCTCPSKEVACKIADALVPAGLAACVNIITSLISVYRWKGDICRDEDVL